MYVTPILKDIQKNGKGFNTLFSHVTLITEEVGLIYPNNENAYMSNLIGMGIVYDQDSLHKIDQTDYEKIKKKSVLKVFSNS